MITGTAPSNCKREKHSSRAYIFFKSFACISAAKLLNQSSSWSEVSFKCFLYCKHSTPFSSVLWQMSEFKGLSSADIMTTGPSQKQTMPQYLSKSVAILHSCWQVSTSRVSIAQYSSFCWILSLNFFQFKVSLERLILGF